ncbi:hypothetical protein [Crocosphaera sp. XPORK-15E]|uniref:hypothetical protein n=1 Tax=Crocosphaera sp. XPORK-15E TaxID=3110247 RepID=UPI002B1FA724|nr:hypothetical protein [Crocosphaera sp. XPORK-15E]MEA5535259.1 hypothetical protein [Crocosphaera sp. XPORK-15E]
MLTINSTDKLLQRIGTQPNGNVWSVIVVPLSEVETVAEELQDLIGIFAECEIELISAKQSHQKMLETIINTSAEYIILFEFENWHQENWRKLDVFRSHLDQKKKGGILILTINSVKQLLSYSPNFASWLGGRVYRLNIGEEFLNNEQIEKRLKALQIWSGLSDNEVIEIAKNNQLPSDPEYAEWLVLLDREDLIER